MPKRLPIPLNPIKLNLFVFSFTDTDKKSSLENPTSRTIAHFKQKNKHQLA